jgi:hypothetical protein
MRVSANSRPAQINQSALPEQTAPEGRTSTTGCNTWDGPSSHVLPDHDRQPHLQCNLQQSVFQPHWDSKMGLCPFVASNDEWAHHRTKHRRNHSCPCRLRRTTYTSYLEAGNARARDGSRCRRKHDQARAVLFSIYAEDRLHSNLEQQAISRRVGTVAPHDLHQPTAKAN